MSNKDQAELDIEPWPRQAQAIETDSTELLFGGASEGGKSHFIRMALILWCVMIPGLQCLILRKYYNDVIQNHMQGENNFKIMLAPWIKHGIVKTTENQVKFPLHGDSLITMAQCRTEEDFEKAQGISKHVLVWDEATQIKARYINDIRGWVRMSNEMKAEIPLEHRDNFPRIIYTANPIGESVSFFKRMFITPRKPFEKEKVGAFIRQFIPSLVTDNKSADPVAQRERLSQMHSANVAEALITGSWETAVGDFFTEYDDDLHVIPNHVPASYLFKFRTFDWGSDDPFAVQWWYVADSETVVQDRIIPRGALVCYREWYGNNPENPAKGVHMRNEDIAKGIVSRTHEAMSGITLSDSWPFADRGGSKNGIKFTMADEFFDNGCPLTLGNCARVYGWKQLRSRLQGQSGVPLIYWVESCAAARDYIPALPHHDTKPEDAAESGESTHICDCSRLACTAKPLVKEAPRETPKVFNKTMTPQTILKQLTAKKRSNFGSRV